VLEHRAVLDALRSGDAEEAVRILDQHRAHAVAALAEMLRDQP
jgi:DNA-binding GntR family transcriptional regulator